MAESPTFHRRSGVSLQIGDFTIFTVTTLFIVVHIEGENQCFWSSTVKKPPVLSMLLHRRICSFRAMGHWETLLGGVAALLRFVEGKIHTKSGTTHDMMLWFYLSWLLIFVGFYDMLRL